MHFHAVVDGDDNLLSTSCAVELFLFSYARCYLSSVCLDHHRCQTVVATVHSVDQRELLINYHIFDES